MARQCWEAGFQLLINFCFSLTCCMSKQRSLSLPRCPRFQAGNALTYLSGCEARSLYRAVAGPCSERRRNFHTVAANPLRSASLSRRMPSGTCGLAAKPQRGPRSAPRRQRPRTFPGGRLSRWGSVAGAVAR